MTVSKFASLVGALLVGLLSAQTASALIIDGNDVGGIDNIIGASDTLIVGSCTDPGSNPSNEECWAETFGGVPDLTFATKNDPVPVIYNADRTLAAFMLSTNPGYFIVKNAQAWVLLQNVANTSWGVLDLTSPLLDGLKLNLGKDDQLTISHVTEFNGTVPEPGTLGLLVLALAGGGLLRRLRAA